MLTQEKYEANEVNLEKIKIFKTIISDINAGIRSYNGKTLSKSLLGIIIQILSEKTAEDIIKYVTSYGATYCDDNWNLLTYNELVRKYWLPNLEPKANLLQILSDAGFSRVDVGNIEKFKGSEILKYVTELEEVKIYDTVIKTKIQPKVKKLSYTEEVYRKDWWGRLFGLKETITKEVKVPDGVEEVEYEEKVYKETITRPIQLNIGKVEHMVLYCQAWIFYLEDKVELFNKNYK